MSKLTRDHIFTSESVSEGHPDKICDQISDAILDNALAQDKNARVACETVVSTNLVVNCGEIRVKGWENVNTEQIARNVVKQIGYDNEAYLFYYKNFEYINKLHAQSAEIAQGVEQADNNLGAGDQGIMFGYANNESNDYLPLTVSYSHNLLRHFSTLRRNKKIDFLRPDAKSQISIHYTNGKPKAITSIVLSHQTDDIPYEEIKAKLIAEIKAFFKTSNLITDQTQFYINPTGKFVIGGPHGDAGLTGRKIIVDTYGGMGSHGGGAFSGKDPSKVDRSAAYYARYAAKNIVAAGLADQCEIQVSYAIGVSHPISINVNTFGSHKITEVAIENLLQNRKIFDFRPAAIIEELDLLKPDGWSYQQTANYGHFTDPTYPWEQMNKIKAIQNAT
ncbi:s-adenosylmethionine synthase [Spirochaetota bacterium]|nr:s-adenosylmethionine synthase [Spirochaetota bacterium]